MDARIETLSQLGLKLGDVHVIRNAGGRVEDATLRSLAISYKLLGTNQIYVIHHTDCGMTFFNQDTMENLLASSLETAALTPEGFKDVGKGPGTNAGKYIKWLTINPGQEGEAQAVRDDIDRIKASPLIPDNIKQNTFGYIYDVRSGKLVPVAAK
jgi:carbonic anhydrase